MRDPWKKLLAKVKLCASDRASRSRTKEVHIDINDLKKQFTRQHGRCYWLHIPIDMNNIFIPNHPGSPSVDRLDNSKDYTPDNIVICTSFANMGRGRTDVETMEQFLNENNLTKNTGCDHVEISNQEIQGGS